MEPSAVARHIGMLHERLDDLYYQVAEHQRRMANMIRPGTLKSYDAKNAVGVADLGFETKPLPWFEHAGGFKTWNPPTPGQQLMAFSPSGEPGLGLLVPYGYSQQNAAPSQDAGENVIAIRGKTRLSIRDDAFVFAVDSQSLTLDASGMTVKAHKYSGVKV